MDLSKDTMNLYDKIVEASFINLIDFSKRNKRENFYIPHSYCREIELYNIEIAKLVAQVTDIGIDTITYKVDNFEDFKFLMSQKWKMRKNKCRIKKARKKDINNDIFFFTNFMNQEFNITNDTYKRIYNAYFRLENNNE